MSDLSQTAVKAMLEDLLCDIDCGALRFGVEFVQDLNKHFKARGSLTEKQEAALRKIYTSHMGE